MKFFLSPQEMAKAMSAHLDPLPQAPISGTSTDTREDCQHKLFFPLKGENFDGHHYLIQAVKSGASGVVCQQGRDLPKHFPKDRGVFYVKDPLKAYQNLAKTLRHKLKPKVIAITGSNGKTTTKGFVATLLQGPYQTVVSKASFNNHVGVPQTLLQTLPETEVVVLEMGMNHPHEIKELVMIADPDVVLVTTVGRSHLEGLKTIEQIAKAKEEIYKYAKTKALRIFNLDNPWTYQMHKKYDPPSLTFSKTHKTADVHFYIKTSNLESLTVAGSIQGQDGQATVPIFGEHHLHNLMASASVALAVGLSPSHIWQSLPACRGQWGRTQILTLQSGNKIVFDAYNANPDSMEALLAQIAKCKNHGKWHICLGDMLELGPESSQFHTLLGQTVAQTIHASHQKLGLMAFVGRFGKAFQKGMDKTGWSQKVMLLDTYQSSLARELQSRLQPEDVIVIKASRGVQLERLLKDLSEKDQNKV